MYLVIQLQWVDCISALFMNPHSFLHVKYQTLRVLSINSAIAFICLHSIRSVYEMRVTAREQTRAAARPQ